MEWNVSPMKFVSTYLQNKDGICILDVRETDEYRSYHIPDSLLISLDDLYTKIREVPQTKPIYVICEHGIRSIQATMILYDAGYHDVYNVMGGFEKILAYPEIAIANLSTS